MGGDHFGAGLKCQSPKPAILTPKYEILTPKSQTLKVGSVVGLTCPAGTLAVRTRHIPLNNARHVPHTTPAMSHKKNSTWTSASGGVGGGLDHFGAPRRAPPRCGLRVHPHHASVLERVAKSQFVPGRCDCQKSSASLLTRLKRSTPSITLAWQAFIVQGSGSRMFRVKSGGWNV